MASQFRERIQALKGSGRGIGDFENVAKDVIGSGVPVAEKRSLLNEVRNAAFEKGIELSAMYANTLSEDDKQASGGSVSEDASFKPGVSAGW